MRRIQLFDEHFPTHPGHDTGISHAIARGVSDAAIGETLRLHHTTDIVAFGRHDTLMPGYPAAVSAAIQRGFTPIERLAGGRAAVFHEGTLAFAWAIPTSEPRDGVMDRFDTIAEILRDALRSLDVDAVIGQIPGEYCPGSHSIHAEHRVKLVGVGQRLLRGAAHVGGVISVSNGSRIREALEPVYSELGLEWEPTTAGAIDDFVPGTTVDTVRDAVVDAFAARFTIDPTEMPAGVIYRGLELAPSHISAS